MTAAVSTASYEADAFEVLHHALLAAQCAEAGPQLDALDSALKRLDQACRTNTTRLVRLQSEQGSHHLAQGLLEREVQQARAVADAVDAVRQFVRARALGELDQRELNAEWLRLWGTVAPAPRQANSGAGQPRFPSAPSTN